MAIQWFPGHMHKARKEMAMVLPDTDVILEVLDARIPFSSENPMLEQLRGRKPCLKVLTKSDLADDNQTNIWLEAYESHTTKSIKISSQDTLSIKAIQPLIKTMVKPSQSRVNPFVVMVVGIPNVGKSTLINLLAGRTVAKTGNEPAITKRQQHIVLTDHWVLRDTPGVLWPNVDNPYSGYRLAATGAIRDTAMDSADVATHLLDYLCVHYPEQLVQRYGADLPLDSSVGTLEAIGRNRGCIGGRGLVDFDRSARLLLTEFRAGRLGDMTLETPDMKLKELSDVEIIRAEKAVKKEEKKAARKAARKSRHSRS
ncbi:MAG: ribosome biogenesis GTPase YlqF [Gammaproteobacteria bacterium]|nr:ribosome biogenesis GTPase YlqF [Gammaproteobacteria bacterium]